MVLYFTDSSVMLLYYIVQQDNLTQKQWGQIKFVTGSYSLKENLPPQKQFVEIKSHNLLLNATLASWSLNRSNSKHTWFPMDRSICTYWYYTDYIIYFTTIDANIHTSVLIPTQGTTVTAGEQCVHSAYNIGCGFWKFLQNKLLQHKEGIKDKN